jgi:hypothetical protein
MAKARGESKKMKKTIMVLIAVAILTSQSFAALTFTLDRSSLDFGTMNNGDFKELPASGNYNTALITSNVASPWQLSIGVTQALTSLAFPTITIPNDSFRWISTYAGHWDNGSSTQWDMSGGLNHPPVLGYVNFSTIDEPVYTSGRVAGKNDNNNNPTGTQVQFKYAISMPGTQTAGVYTTTIRYTVTQ